MNDIARAYWPVGVAMGVFAAHTLATMALDRGLASLPALLALNVILSVAFLGIRYPGAAPELRFLTAGIGLVLGTYVLIFPHWLPETLRDAWPLLTTLVDGGRWVVPVFALVGIFRPSAVLMVTGYAAVLRLAYPYLYGLGRVGGSDYIPLVEIGAFAALSTVSWSVLAASVPRFRSRLPEPFDRVGVPRQALTGIFVVAVGAFFANYFYSGLTKILLDGGPLAWVRDNRTAGMVPMTMTTGHLPIGHWPALASGFYEWFSRLTVGSNAIVLASELGALVAIWKKRWIVAMAAVYSVFHILIFVSSGIFFWKWIALNAVIAGAVRRWRHRHGPLTRMIAVSSVLAAGPLPFTTMTLGWFESPAINRFFFEVELDDGERYELPTNFFGPVSLTPAQMRLGTFGPSLWPTRTWGMTWIDSDRERLALCDPALRGPESAYIAVDWPRLEAFFGRVLAYHREHPGARYDFLPHHIFSNPNLFAFRPDMTLRITKAYYVSESYCVQMNDASGRKTDVVREERQVFGEPGGAG